MKQDNKEKVLIYLNEFIDDCIKKQKYYKQEAIATKLRKKFPELYKKEKTPAVGTVSKYMAELGYKCDNGNQRYEICAYANLNKKKLKCYDQPFLTIIKTSLKDLANVKERVLIYFKADILYMKEETTDKEGILFIYSTKYNLGSIFNEEIKKTKKQSDTEKEED